jgi:hypothetical protein
MSVSVGICSYYKTEGEISEDSNLLGIKAKIRGLKSLSRIKTATYTYNNSPIQEKHNGC